MVISQVIISGWYGSSGITALLEGGCLPEKRGASKVICLHLSGHWEGTWAQSSRDSVCAWPWPCLGLSSHAEAGRVPCAGYPRPSQSAGAGHQGSPQGALCATAGAGVTVGSASVTWESQACTSGPFVSATNGCARPTTGAPVQVREGSVSSPWHATLAGMGKNFLLRFLPVPRGEKCEDRSLHTWPSRKLLPSRRYSLASLFWNRVL